jgi:hypothetical protein
MEEEGRRRPIQWCVRQGQGAFAWVVMAATFPALADFRRNEEVLMRRGGGDGPTIGIRVVGHGNGFSVGQKK